MTPMSRHLHPPTRCRSMPRDPRHPTPRGTSPPRRTTSLPPKTAAPPRPTRSPSINWPHRAPSPRSRRACNRATPTAWSSSPAPRGTHCRPTSPTTILSSGRAAAVPALAALSATWKAIGSTAAVNANANTLTRGSDPSTPIYRLDGALVADGNSDLWNASTNLYNSISITEAGNAVNVWVWTGTTGDGTPWTGNGSRLGDGGWILDGKSTAVWASPGNSVGI